MRYKILNLFFYFYNVLLTLHSDISTFSNNISDTFELVAHSFFHHIQHTVFKFYDPSKLWDMIKGYRLSRREVEDLVINIFESSAMFFAVAYLTRELGSKTKKVKILKYLNSEAYTTPKGKFFSGDDIILLLYEYNNHDTAKTIKQTLTYGGQTMMVTKFLKSKLV